MVEFEKRWSTYQLFLAGLMVTTGTLNTLSAKWADMMEANHAEFRHPFLQVRQEFKTALDSQTSLPRQPSLLGATIIFTGLLSVAFLGSVLRWFKWTGMFFVLCGLILVGLADLINDTPKDPNGMLSGDLLVILAQIVVAVQMVYEQKFLCKYNVYPLLAVGLEGAFGVILMIIVCVVFYFVKVPRLFTVDPEMRLENVLFALYQIEENNLI
ncbi:unnamed protein product, partial [Soboliphyme baturini]|uniref:SLC26A/SulP transporter domain-containing protein n=1 Tax=Soboliphyme baturini TaxID=241478 RepID=A0A183IMT3_9BILA